MFTRDTVTVVTAATGHRNLPLCLRSVKRQTYPQVRHWVVIDGPEHETRVRAAIAELGDVSESLEVLCLPEATGKDKWCGHRIYAAASYLVNTEFIAFLDEDNWLEPDHVESLVAALRSTEASWAFSLRNIVDEAGTFIAHDDCESLGNLHPVFFDKDQFHIDTNCYLLKREIAVQFSHAWYRPTGLPAWQQQPDTYLCNLLLQHCPPGCSNRRYTVNYTVGNRHDSVRAEFFLQGNRVMRQAYPAGLPWEQPASVTAATAAQPVRDFMNYRSFAMRLEEIAHFLDVHQQCSGIEGWLHPLEGYFLHLLAAEGPGLGEIVEIGSYMGLSTAYLASGSKSTRREKVSAVDHFRGSPENQAGQSAESKVLLQEGTTLPRFQSNLQRLGLADYATPLVASSEEAVRGWSKPIRLLFIDGEHSYEAVRRDFELWSPFVAPGGMVGFHDVGQWPDVTRFYQDLMQSTKLFQERLAVQSIRAIQRMER